MAIGWLVGLADLLFPRACALCGEGLEGPPHDERAHAPVTALPGGSAASRLAGGHPGDAFLHDLAHNLEHRYSIEHATVQVEIGGEHDCHLHEAHGTEGRGHG